MNTRTCRPVHGPEQHRADLARCVKCGSCRAVCPSFLVSREESFSPRGRVALVRAVLDGRLAPSALYEDRIETCTGCLACESACASNVPVTAIIQAAKEQAVAQSGPGIMKSLVGRALRNRHLMEGSAWLAPLALHYARASVRAPAAGSSSSAFRSVFSSSVRRRRSKNKSRVVFFPGCAIGYFQPGIGKAALDVLCAAGYEPEVPRGLACCGRPMLSLGDREGARKAAEQNSRIFARADIVLTACASCSLTFKKEYPRLLPPARRQPVFLDLHEFLVHELAGAGLRPLERTVTWHDPCHLTRGQGLAGAARDLVRAIPGVRLVEMKDADRCCGFGGVMRITHREVSDSIGDRKAADIIATGADAVVTGCPGCRMQIADALRRAGSNIVALHTAQLLQEALGGADRIRRELPDSIVDCSSVPGKDEP